MRSGFKLGEFELIWLNGGRFELDGGAMFGVVPKVLWQKKYPVDAENYIPMRAWPILVKTPQALVLIETGLGNKLTDKQKKIYRVREEWSLPAELKQLGLDREDIDHVILTHYDFDHAGGVIMEENGGGLGITFPKAKHVIQQKEWNDVLNPNIRNINTFWPVNNELLRTSGNLDQVDGMKEVVPGITVIGTGGHSNGHQIVKLASKGETAFHLADLLPTHAHANPLWIMAYDNYPMDSISKKETWLAASRKERAWLTLYHDSTMLACKLDEAGTVTERWGAET